MKNYIDEIIKEFDEERLSIIIGGFCYSQDGGNGGYDFEDITNFIKNFLKQKLQDLEKIYSSARKTYLLGYEEGKEEGKHNTVEGIKEKLKNAKTVKSEMEEMESKAFSDGYQKALEDIFSTNQK